MSQIIFVLASSFVVALSFGVAGSADARPLSLTSADRNAPACVDDDCPDPCVDDGCEPDPCVDDGCEPVPKLELDLCIELDIKLDVPCVIKVADDCEDSCDARAVTPACLQKLGPRASGRGLEQCQADYQALCVSQCEDEDAGFCQDVWVGKGVCLDLQG